MNASIHTINALKHRAAETVRDWRDAEKKYGEYRFSEAGGNASCRRNWAHFRKESVRRLAAATAAKDAYVNAVAIIMEMPTDDAYRWIVNGAPLRGDTEADEKAEDTDGNGEAEGAVEISELYDGGPTPWEVQASFSAPYRGWRRLVKSDVWRSLLIELGRAQKG